VTVTAQTSKKRTAVLVCSHAGWSPNLMFQTICLQDLCSLHLNNDVTLEKSHVSRWETGYHHPPHRADGHLCIRPTQQLAHGPFSISSQFLPAFFLQGMGGK
jgi:hypothetical protein